MSRRGTFWEEEDDDVVYVCGILEHEYEFELFDLLLSGSLQSCFGPVVDLYSLSLENDWILGLPRRPAQMHPNMVSELSGAKGAQERRSFVIAGYLPHRACITNPQGADNDLDRIISFLFISSPFSLLFRISGISRCKC